jgi:hypothetical protein
MSRMFPSDKATSTRRSSPRSRRIIAHRAHVCGPLAMMGGVKAALVASVCLTVG